MTQSQVQSLILYEAMAVVGTSAVIGVVLGYGVQVEVFSIVVNVLESKGGN